MAVFNLVALAFCCFANSVNANIDKAASSHSFSFSYSHEPEKMSWLFSATGIFTGDRNAGSFVMEETTNVIGFTDRPFREAKPMALAEVARKFEGAEEFNPPNAILTITENSCTQEESVVSIPVTLRSHTYFENEPDKMGFTYTLLGEVTTRQSEALQCQQCPLTIFVDDFWEYIPIIGLVHAFKAYQCDCRAGLWIYGSTTFNYFGGQDSGPSPRCSCKEYYGDCTGCGYCLAKTENECNPDTGVSNTGSGDSCCVGENQGPEYCPGRGQYSHDDYECHFGDGTGRGP